MKRYRANRKLFDIADALSRAVDTPLNGAAVQVTARALQSLGIKLRRIANGENACDVLDQTKHGAEPKTDQHLAIAYIYWRRFVEGAEKRDAIAAVKEAISGAKDIYGVAQRYRKHFLGTDSTSGKLNGHTGALEFDDDITEAQLAAARVRISKRNRRGRS